MTQAHKLDLAIALQNSFRYTRWAESLDI